MATLILNCSSGGNSAGFTNNAQIRLTYTAENGVFALTEVEGIRNDGYRSYAADKKTITVTVDGTSKSVALGNYVDFNTSWAAFGATDTTWSGITKSSINISVDMPTSEASFNGAKFTGSVDMLWSTYTISYDANGGSGAPNNQTKTHGTALTLTSVKPVRTGYTFSRWNTKSDGTGISYNAGGSYAANASVTLYAIWTETVLNIKTLNGINFPGLDGTYFLPRYALIKNANGDIVLTCSDGSESSVSAISSVSDSDPSIEERLAALEAAILNLTNN